MWLKITGGLILVGSTAYMGHLASVDLERRLQMVRGLRSGLEVLETEIAFGATPLDMALKRVSAAVDGGAATFFETAASALRGDTRTTGPEAFTAALREAERRSPIGKPEFEVLSALSFSIGVSDVKDQVRHVRLAEERLKVIEEKVALEVEKNARLYRILGLFGGLALALAII
ncbi:MAG TPA: hypothetical protein GX507_03190 [Clostridia bacterium]|nr:hypothetical protein [Clostridia bacterium]